MVNADQVPLVVYQPPKTNLTPEQQQFRANMQDVLFPFDQATLNLPEAQAALQNNAQWLKEHPDATFFIEGYADWRGNIPYNMDLSQRRAEAVRDQLVQMGVPSDRVIVTSGWGKLYPLCAEQDEQCWAQNRRVHLSYKPER